MTYLVEIIYKNALSPIYQYYNTFSEINQMILKSENVESVEIYKLDTKKSELATKLIRK